MSSEKQVFGRSHVPLSPAVRAGELVFVSGQVPVLADGTPVTGGIAEQTRCVLDNVRAALALAGARMDQVVKTTVILADARDFGGMNAVYATYFPEAPPARTTLEARLMVDIRVEIEVIAHAPQAQD